MDEGTTHSDRCWRWHLDCAVRKVEELTAERDEERELRHGLDEGGRVAARRVVELERQAAQDALRIMALEARIEEQSVDFANEYIEELTAERDEARGIAEDMNRRVSLPATLPWEDGE